MPSYDAIEFNMSDLSEHEMYKLMIGSVVPRPIAWVSSKSKEGVLNLAPFSFFTVASRNPPTLLISIGPGVGERDGTVKDTLTNIRELGEYVINMVSEPLGEAMQRSSANVAPSKNEFELAGVTPKPCKCVNVPAVLEAPIAFELKLDRIIPVGGDHLVLGIIEHVQMDPASYAGNFKTAVDKWKPLASLAGDYAGLTTTFSLIHVADKNI
ncbi:flavin reductase family protein [Paenibacillus sp. UMB4589-SE434]|uniref:flavin reductase family protein n=1 Tax=Paenibacillus sp. UMB4589-SE434 TaxID=3046314 RepID=UPI00254F9267|nr:flavin reductase family protein [Paenibacillus sp. UMB4589-SE434]MDK8180127.1 flavin reductase family protein [Paenibacillus sp. UMB4589-SE434]